MFKEIYNTYLPFVSVSILAASGFACSPGLLGLLSDSNRSEGTTSSASNPDMLIIGRSKFGTYDQVFLGAEPSSSGLEGANYVEKVGTQWFVSDFNRLMIFEGSLGNANPVVLGQANSSVVSPLLTGYTPSASTLRNPMQSVVYSGKLIVSDYGANRVLIWNTIPTQSAQAADVVIGQANFTSRTKNQGGANPAANTLWQPTGLAVIGGKLIISDSGNNRLLVFNSIPTSNNASADYALGQADLVSGGANQGGSAAANTLSGPRLLYTDGTKLVVADRFNSRILIYNTLPASNTNADAIVGQSSASGTSTGTTATTLNYPTHAIIAGGHLYVADQSNYRMLYFASVPSSGMGAAATAQIGQADLTSGVAPTWGAASQSTMNGVWSVFSDGTDLYANDGYYRILKFSGLPTPANASQGATTLPASQWGQSSWQYGYIFGGTPNNSNFSLMDSICQNETYLVACDGGLHRCLVFEKSKISSGAVAAIGQADFSSSGANRRTGTPAANSLSLSYSGCEIDSKGRLFVSDGGNNRVLVWNQVPTTSGTNADQVLGQASFTSSATGCTSTTMQTPTMMKAVGNYLYVGTWFNYRALIFDISVPVGTPIPSAAIGVVGQPNLTTCTSGTTASNTDRVLGFAYDGTRFYLNDGFNRRVLVYNSIPTGSGTSADYVLGQTSLTLNSGVGPTASTLGISTGRNYLLNTNFGVIDNYLWLPDIGNNRFLGWNVAGSISNGMSATYLIGQSNFTTGATTYPLGNSTEDDLVHTPYPTVIVEDTSGDYVWLGFQSMIVRMKKKAFQNHWVQ